MTQTPSDRHRWPDAGGAHDLAAIPNGDAILLQPGESFAILGDAYLAQVAPIIATGGHVLIRGEARHPALGDIPGEDGEHDRFSVGCGEIATARQLRQLFQRATGSLRPAEDRWRDGETIVDPFRPGLIYPARSDQEFELLRERHFNAVRAMVRRAATLIVSLEGIEAVEAIGDGAVLPIAADDTRFDPARYVAKIHTLTETIADLTTTVADLRAINPTIRVVLMVSPRPIAWTASGDHIVAADALAKAVLRVAMAQATTIPGVTYFPAREIALAASPAGPDGRTPSSAAVAAVAKAFLGVSVGKGAASTPSFAPIAPGPIAVPEALPRRQAREPRKQPREPRKTRKVQTDATAQAAPERRAGKAAQKAKSAADAPLAGEKKGGRRRAAAAAVPGRNAATPQKERWVSAPASEVPPEATVDVPVRNDRQERMDARKALRQRESGEKTARVPGQRKLDRAKEKAAEPDLSHMSSAERKAHKEYLKVTAERDAKAKDSA